MRSHVVAFAIVAGGAACGDDLPDATADGSSTGLATTTGPASSESSVAPEGTSSSGPGDDTTSDGGTSDTGFDPARPMCGNGYVEGDEQCDDANRTDDDACNNACLVPCGIDWSIIVPGPTLDSIVEGIHVAEAPDMIGGVAVAAFQREITTDKRGNQTIADDTVLVLRVDADGNTLWQVTLGNPAGDLDAAGIAIDAGGDVYVATTLDEAKGGRSIRVDRLASARGDSVWTHDFVGDVPQADDIATGIAITPEGEAVVAGTVRVADGDNDVWVRRLSAMDGSEVWTATHSGVPNGGFSTDAGGPVAVAPDGTVYVLGRIYENFATAHAVLLAFAGDGSGVFDAVDPDLEGTEQQFSPIDVVVDSAGAVYFAFDRAGGIDLDFHVYKRDAMGQVEWALDREAFVGRGVDWRLSGLGLADDELVVAGARGNDFTRGKSEWTEVWVARVDASGMVRCQIEYGEPGRGLVPPSVIARGATGSAGGSAYVTGSLDAEEESGIWLGSFRAQ